MSRRRESLTISDRALSHLKAMAPDVAAEVTRQMEVVPIGSGTTVVEVNVRGTTVRAFIAPDGAGRRLVAAPVIEAPL